MSEDELSYKTLELIRPDLFAQVVALAQIEPPDSVLTLNGEVSELATSALRWAREVEREKPKRRYTWRALKEELKEE